MTRIYSIYIKKDKKTNMFFLNIISYATDEKYTKHITDDLANTFIVSESLNLTYDTPTISMWS